MTREFEIDPAIERARTLPGEVYHDPAWFARQRERVFARTWQYAGDAGRLKAPGSAQPFTLLPGCLDEPLVLVRDGGDDTLRCLSNVCTHRANLVVEGPCQLKGLRCRYHGRRFKLDGRFASMPEFDGAEGFPAASDDLSRVALETWGPLLFANLDPRGAFADLIRPLEERLGWLPWEEFRFDEVGSRTYLVQANWALYCDNYLEGFHIPYVHPSLAGAVDYPSYRTEVFERCNLQLGVAADGEPAFALPAGHPDGDQSIAAFYFWLFPATMINVYPWGLSLNVIEPLAPDRTRVKFLTWVWREELRGEGAGADLDRVEREDEAVVELVQRGVRSRLYERGRYSPRREKGVHHFHRLLAEFLQAD